MLMHQAMDCRRVSHFPELLRQIVWGHCILLSIERDTEACAAVDIELPEAVNNRLFKQFR